MISNDPNEGRLRSTNCVISNSPINYLLGNLVVRVVSVSTVIYSQANAERLNIAKGTLLAIGGVLYDLDHLLSDLIHLGNDLTELVVHKPSDPDRESDVAAIFPYFNTGRPALVRTESQIRSWRAIRIPFP